MRRNRDGRIGTFGVRGSFERALFGLLLLFPLVTAAQAALVPLEKAGASAQAIVAADRAFARASLDSGVVRRS